MPFLGVKSEGCRTTSINIDLAVLSILPERIISITTALFSGTSGEAVCLLLSQFPVVQVLSREKIYEAWGRNSSATHPEPSNYLGMQVKNLFSERIPSSCPWKGEVGLEVVGRRES